MSNTVRYTKTGDNTFNVLSGRTLLGTVDRVEGTAPAKREGKTRKTTTFRFFAAGGDASKPTLETGTMKDLKEKVAATLPKEAEKAEGLPTADAA